MRRIVLILLLSIGFTALSASATGIDGEKIKLGQNYPNPAVGKTFIEAEFTGEATLTIYNVVGKVIEARVVTSGVIELDVSNYTEGIYLYTLESSGEKITKRMKVKKA